MLPKRICYFVLCNGVISVKAFVLHFTCLTYADHHTLDVQTKQVSWIMHESAPYSRHRAGCHTLQSVLGWNTAVALRLHGEPRQRPRVWCEHAFPKSRKSSMHLTCTQKHLPKQAAPSQPKQNLPTGQLSAMTAAVSAPKCLHSTSPSKSTPVSHVHAQRCKLHIICRLVGSAEPTCTPSPPHPRQAPEDPLLGRPC